VPASGQGDGTRKAYDHLEQAVAVLLAGERQADVRQVAQVLAETGCVGAQFLKPGMVEVQIGVEAVSLLLRWFGA
jgi:hypothetical protein